MSNQTPYELLREFDAVLRRESGLDDELVNRLSHYRQFLQWEASALMEHPNSFLPLAHAQARNSLVLRDARDKAETGDQPNGVWLRLLNSDEVDSRPVWTQLVTGRFPKAISLDCAFSGGRIVAGFENQLVLIDATIGQILDRVKVGLKGLGITSISISSDGLYVVSSDSDAMLQLWEIRDDRLIQRDVIEDDAAWVLNVCFSGNRYIISEGRSNVLNVWEVHNGRLGPCDTAYGHKGLVQCISASSNTPYVVSAGDDYRLRLWALDNGKLIERNVIEGSARALCISPDGRFVVSAQDAITLWEVEDGRLVERHTPKREAREDKTVDVSSLRFSSDSRYVVSGDKDSVRLWEVKDGNLIEHDIARGHTDEVTSVAFSSDGHCVVSSSFDQTVRMWQLDKERHIESKYAYNPPVNDVSISPDGCLAVSVCWGDTIRLWDVERGQLTTRGTAQGRRTTSLSISSDNRYVVSGSDHDVVLWYVVDGHLSELHKAGGHTALVNSVSISSDNRYVVSGGDDQTIRLWEVSNNQLIERYVASELKSSGYGNSIQSVVFSSDNRYVVAGRWDGTVVLWVLRDGRLSVCHTLEHGGRLGCLGISSDNRFVVSGGGGDGAILRVWELKEGQLIERDVVEGFWGTAESLSFTSDDRFLISGSCYDRRVRLWQFDEGQLRLARNQPPQFACGVTSVSVSSNSYVVSGCQGGAVRLMELKDGCLHGSQYPPAAMQGRVSSLSFASNYVVATSKDSASKLWAVEGASLVIRDTTQENTYGSASLSSDGRYVVFGNDGQVALWRVEGGSLDLLNRASFHGNYVDFSSDGRYVYSGGPVIALWMIEEDRLNKIQETVNDGTKTAVSGTGYGVSWDFAGLYIWEIRKREFIKRDVVEQRRDTQAVGISQDGCYVASGHYGGELNLWHIRDGRLTDCYEATGHMDGITSLSFSFDNRYVVSGSRDQTLRLWEVRDATLRELTRLPFLEPVSSVCFDKGPTYRVVVGLENGRVYLLQAEGLCQPFIRNQNEFLA